MADGNLHNLGISSQFFQRIHALKHRLQHDTGKNDPDIRILLHRLLHDFSDISTGASDKHGVWCREVLQGVRSFSFHNLQVSQMKFLPVLLNQTACLFFTFHGINDSACRLTGQFYRYASRSCADIPDHLFRRDLKE